MCVWCSNKGVSRKTETLWHIKGKHTREGEEDGHADRIKSCIESISQLSNVEKTTSEGRAPFLLSSRVSSQNILFTFSWIPLREQFHYTTLLFSVQVQIAQRGFTFVTLFRAGEEKTEAWTDKLLKLEFCIDPNLESKSASCFCFFCVKLLSCTVLGQIDMKHLHCINYFLKEKFILMH